MRYSVFRDKKGRYCLKIKEQNGVVYFIPTPEKGGYTIEATSYESFNLRYTHIPGQPVKFQAGIIKEMAMMLGGTEDMVNALADIIPITKSEKQTIKTR